MQRVWKHTPSTGKACIHTCFGNSLTAQLKSRRRGLFTLPLPSLWSTFHSTGQNVFRPAPRSGPHPGQTHITSVWRTPVYAAAPFYWSNQSECKSRATAEGPSKTSAAWFPCVRALITRINLQDPHECAGLLREKWNFLKHAWGPQIDTTKSF